MNELDDYWKIWSTSKTNRYDEKVKEFMRNTGDHGLTNAIRWSEPAVQAEQYVNVIRDVEHHISENGMNIGDAIRHVAGIMRKRLLEHSVLEYVDQNRHAASAYALAYRDMCEMLSESAESE